MARIRTIKPTFFMNDELAELAPLTRLLYVGLWTQADREGRMEDRPRRLKANVLPYDSCDVDAMLDELHASGHIIRYEVDGSRFIQVVNFTKHQAPNIKEQPSTIPAPDEHHASTVQECQERKEGKERKGRDARAEVEKPEGKPLTSVGFPPCLNAEIEVIDPAYTGSCWGFIVGQAEAQFGNLLSHAERTELAEAITRGCIPGCKGDHPQGCAVHAYDKLKLKGKTSFRTSRLWLKCILEDRMEVRQ
ncbi:MAG: hypothetical protein RBR38_15090 [Desulfomicrobium apsheronum]|nr:hypothetical protein [Desulfomicrobium apsheronum]